MSLINEMLRDLEARRAGDLVKPDLQREIRPLPQVRQGGSRWFLMLVAALVTGGLGVMAWLQVDSIQPAKDVLSPVQSPQPASTPPSVPPADPAPAVISEALRLATTLDSTPADSPPLPAGLPEKPTETTKLGDPRIPPSAQQGAAAAKADAPPARPKVPETAQIQGNIEKTVVLGTARDKAEGEYRRAQQLLASGQSAAAQEILQAALHQDASYIPARQALLRLLLEARRVDEAIAVLQEGLEQQPAQIAWALSLARLLVERGDSAAAERVLSRSASHAAGNAEFAGFHGYLLIRNGQFHPAVERYQLATRLSPGDGRWWFGLGQALEGDGHQQEAREAFRRALAAGNLNADLASLAEQKVR